MNARQIFAAALLLLVAPCAVAAGQSSANYSIRIDSVNAGIANTSSSNFSLGSTVGEAVFSTQTNSANFRVVNGFLGAAGALSAPGAPTLNSIAAGPGSATLSFSAPANNGGAAISSYTATCTASGQLTRTATGAGSPLKVSGLTGGVAYSCSLTATNSGGLTSSSSGPVSVTPVRSSGAALLMYLLD
jgi:hypothetical protein